LVPALLHDPDFRERHGDAVDRKRAERTLDFGGIRIERGAACNADKSISRSSLLTLPARPRARPRGVAILDGVPPG
jgi:hypothetical protein